MEQQSDNKKLGYIEKKIDEITFRLFGNKKMDRGDEGVIGEILGDIRLLKANQNEMKEKQIKSDVKTAVMWAALGGTATLIVAYFISQVTHHV